MFPKMTPMYDQVRTLTAVNDLIFAAAAQAESVLAEMKSMDLDMDTLSNEAQLVSLWLKRFPNNRAWVKACARVVETHAMTCAGPTPSSRQKTRLRWEWMDAVRHSLPQASAALRKAWAVSTTVPFWLVYRGYASVESLSSVLDEAWQDFAIGSASTEIPRNVLMEVADKCWALPEFGPGTAKRGLLAFMLFQRGCHLYHDRFKMADLDLEPFDANSRRFLYWGFATAAWDFDGKCVKLAKELVQDLLCTEGSTLLLVHEHAFFTGGANPLANTDSDDLEYIREKLKAPWAVLGEVIEVDQLTFEGAVAVRLPQLKAYLDCAPVPTTNSEVWFENLRAKLVA